MAKNRSWIQKKNGFLKWVGSHIMLDRTFFSQPLNILTGNAQVLAQNLFSMLA